MNSLSLRTLPRVASSILKARSTLPKIDTRVSLLDANYLISSTAARTIRTQITSLVSAAQHAEPRNGFVKRIFEKYNLFNMSNMRLKRSGYMLYESVADKIDHTEFFIEFNMSDTFFSWFLVTELHVWMLMVRTMHEQEEGRVVRNSLVEAMWEDANTRAKVLWSENPGGVRRHIQELSEQFNCAIIGYDEGVGGDDKILAGAIWRRFFKLECNNPEDVEKLLIYVRKQIQYLDKLAKKDVLLKPDINWLPLSDV